MGLCTYFRNTLYIYTYDERIIALFAEENPLFKYAQQKLSVEFKRKIPGIENSVQHLPLLRVVPPSKEVPTTWCLMFLTP